MADTIQSGRSFWQRPEGTTGKALIALTSAAGLYVLYRYDILGKLIQLAEDAIHLTILGTVLTALYFFLTSKRVKATAFYAFQIFTRWLTGFVIDIDPVAILKSFNGVMRAKRKQVEASLAGIAGVGRTLDMKIRESEKEMQAAVRLADAAEKSGDEYGLDLQAEKAARRDKNIREYKEMYSVVQDIVSMLQRVLRRVDYHIANSEDELKELQDKNKLAEEMRRATAAAHSVLGDSELLEIRNEAADRIREKYSNALGELDTLIHMSADFDREIDLNQLAFRTEGRKKLEELRRQMDVIEAAPQPRKITGGVQIPEIYTGKGEQPAVPVPSAGWRDRIRKND